jgi:glutamate dehydrogenase (NADP+)
VAQYTTEKINHLGGKVVTLSDSTGYIYDEKGIDTEKLGYVMYLKNVKRGRIKEYVDKYSDAVYTEFNPASAHNPLWTHKADCAFPSATQNEINEIDAQNLVNNGVQVVCEGANMPTTLEGIDIFLDHKILFAPGKAANAGGVAVSGLEMAQNAMRIKWNSQEVEERLRKIMQHIHVACLAASEEYGTPGNYVNGANIAGFVKVADAMMDQGVV